MDKTFKVRDKLTGSIIEVSAGDLPNYGLSAPETKTKEQVLNDSHEYKGQKAGLPDVVTKGMKMFSLGPVADVVNQGANIAGSIGDYGRYKTGQLLNDKGMQTRAIRDYTAKADELKKLQGEYGFDSQNNKFDIKKYLTKEGKGGAQMASYAVPASTALTGLKGYAAASGLGATGSALSELGQDNATPKSVLAAAGTGAVLGPVFKGLGDFKNTIVKKIKSEGRGQLAQVLHPTPTELVEYKKFTEGRNFYSDVIDKDLPDLTGKNSSEIADYFTKKHDDMYNAADTFLAERNKKLDKAIPVGEVLKSYNAIVKYPENPEMVRIGGSPAKNRLLEIFSNFLGFDDFNSMKSFLKGNKNILADDLPPITLTTLNQAKRDIEDLAPSYYTAKGDPSIASKALADLARKLGDIIEKNAPGFKNINREIQYTRLAKDASTRMAFKGETSSGLMSALLRPLGGLTGVALIGGGHPYAGSAAFLGSMMAPEILKSTKFKTAVADTALNKIPNKIVTPEFLQKAVRSGTSNVPAFLLRNNANQ